MKTRNIFFTILFSLLSVSLVAQNLVINGIPLRVYIDPGHGGWSPDDRGIRTPLFPVVSPGVGFWESQSNLIKGRGLRGLIEDAGGVTMMSRDSTWGTIQGQTAGLPLATIVRQANEFNSDFMISIHSNAGNAVSNYVLMLFAGRDLTDTNNYAHLPPQWAQDRGRTISTRVARNIFGNQLTYWTRNYWVIGDKTFGRLHMGWSNGFGVLRGLNVPGLLSEASMHDYTPETYRLMSASYKWLEAWNFFEAIVNYFTDEDIPTGNIAGWVKCDRLHLIEEGQFAGYRRFGPTDYLLPLCGATVTLRKGDDVVKVYTVDNFRNGVYVFRLLEPGAYTITAEFDGYYPYTQVVTVERNQITYFNFRMERIRNTPPQVVEHTPEDGVAAEASTHIVLEFNWDMDTVSVRNAFSITPHVKGTMTFEDSQHRMRFIPNFTLDASTTYTVRLDKSAQHPGGIGMDEDFVFTFTTKERNRLVLLEGYPFDGAERVHINSVFWYVFDRRLEPASSRSEIRVFDDAGNELSMASRPPPRNNIAPAPYGDIQFELQNPLRPNRTYRVVIDGGVRDEVGIMVVEPIEITFTTANVATNHGTVIEDFNTAGRLVFDAESSNNVTGASVARNTTAGMRLFGQASGRFRATFTNENAEVTFRVADPIATVNNGQVIGMHIHGDMSSNEIQLLFSGSNGEQVVPVCRLWFVGWRFVEVDLSSLPSGEHTFVGIRVVHRSSVLSRTLDINLDNMLLYNERLFPSEDWLFKTDNPEIWATQITIYPNPASDMIFVRTELNEIPLLQLFSFSGQLLREARANEISVIDLSTGTYILIVNTGREIHRKPVIVVR